jgi:hypothetical protein
MYSWSRSSRWQHHSRLLLRLSGLDWEQSQSLSLFAKYLTRSQPTGQWTGSAVMLKSVYVHGVKGLEAVNRDSLQALPSPAVVGHNFIHQFVQLTFDLPLSGPVQRKLPGLAPPESGRPQPHRLGGLVRSSVLVVSLAFPIFLHT